MRHSSFCWKYTLRVHRNHGNDYCTIWTLINISSLTRVWHFAPVLLWHRCQILIHSSLTAHLGSWHHYYRWQVSLVCVRYIWLTGTNTWTHSYIYCYHNDIILYYHTCCSEDLVLEWFALMSFYGTLPYKEMVHILDPTWGKYKMLYSSLY